MWTIYLQQTRRNGHMPQGLMLIDCDRFKQVNDVHGHLAGDRVLQSLGNILRSVTSSQDLACRLGGDEFCLLIYRTDAAQLSAMMDFVLTAVRRLASRSSGGIPRICPVSVGGCLVELQDSWNDAYSRADAALYEAKRRGGNQARWFVQPRHASQSPA